MVRTGTFTGSSNANQSLVPGRQGWLRLNPPVISVRARSRAMRPFPRIQTRRLPLCGSGDQVSIGGQYCAQVSPGALLPALRPGDDRHYPAYRAIGGHADDIEKQVLAFWQRVEGQNGARSLRRMAARGGRIADLRQRPEGRKPQNGGQSAVHRRTPRARVETAVSRPASPRSAASAAAPARRRRQPQASSPRSAAKPHPSVSGAASCRPT